MPPAAAHLVGQILFALTPYYNDATVINFVGRLSFVFATLFGFVWITSERELLRSVRFWIGVVFALTGLVGIYVGGEHSGSTSAIGMMILVGAAACWGLYSVLVRQCLRGYSLRLGYGVISLYVGPIIVGLGWWLGRDGAWQKVTLEDVAWLAGSGIAGLALGHVLFFRAIHSLGPIRAEAALLLIPFLTAVFAMPLRGERLTSVQWMGSVLLVIGCYSVLFGRRVEQIDQEGRETPACLSG